MRGAAHVSTEEINDLDEPGVPVLGKGLAWHLDADGNGQRAHRALRSISVGV
jgi:hypothetical protein